MEDRRLWDNRQFVRTVRVSAKRKYEVTITARRGIKYVVISTKVRLKDEEQWQYFKPSISIPITTMVNGYILTPAGNLIDAMLAGIEQSGRMALDDPNNYVYVRKRRVRNAGRY